MRQAAIQGGVILTDEITLGDEPSCCPQGSVKGPTALGTMPDISTRQGWRKKGRDG